MRAGIDYDSEAAWALWDFVFGLLFLNVLLWRLAGVPESNWSLSMMIAGTVFVNALLWRLSGDFHNEWPLWVLVLGAVFLNAVLWRFGGELGGGGSAPRRQMEDEGVPVESGLDQVSTLDQPLQRRQIFGEFRVTGLEHLHPGLDKTPGVVADKEKLIGLGHGGQDLALFGTAGARSPPQHSPQPNAQRFDKIEYPAHLQGSCLKTSSAGFATGL